MQYYRCKCGKIEIYGPMLTKCVWCKDCKTTPALSSDLHETEQPPHRMYEFPVETDEGMKVSTRCVFCNKSQAELEEAGEPMSFIKQDGTATSETDQSTEPKCDG